jgi:hypothetical protein
MDFISITNNQRIDLAEIPTLPYEQFFDVITNQLMPPAVAHCVNYFAIPEGSLLKLICCIANDSDGLIHLVSSKVEANQHLPSITEKYLAFHAFERELNENYGLKFEGHPWMKPIRYPIDQANKNSTIANYPFYTIESEELHEVGVGPIHAGVIEPGHFRFICNGEQILHLEIQLGISIGVSKNYLSGKKGFCNGLH